MKNTLYAIIAFSALLLIAIAYQLHLIDLTKNINSASSQIILSIKNEDYSDAATLLSKLEDTWNKNTKLLMAFHDHSSINSASIFLELALNNFKTKEYTQISDNLISFTSILNELAAENIPSLENIL